MNFKRPRSLKDKITHYCPGCGHGVVHRLIAEVVDELKIRRKTVGIAPVGCAVLAYDYWDFDVSEAAHGRTLAVATGIKRVRPDLVVFSYQGDGDLAAIGAAETLHAANRAENLTCIFINNACYGMTGAQMAPTTAIGQKTATTPGGRNPQEGDGYPLIISELLARLRGVCFVERTTVITPSDVLKTKKAILKAFLNQIDKRGFSLVEVLSPCPTGWGLSPQKAAEFIKEKLSREFPLGVIKDEA